MKINKTVCISFILMVLLCIGIIAIENIVNAEQTSPLKIWGQNTNGDYNTLVVIDEETGINYIVVSYDDERQNSAHAASIAICPRYETIGGRLYASK